jgi:signal transduction histidine kinase
MRLSLRYRLLLPLVALLLVDVIVTAWAARDAAVRAEQRIDDQLRAVARTLSEPPTFPLTSAVLAKMKELSGAEFALTRRTGETESTFDPPVKGFNPAAEVTVQGETYRVTWLLLPDGHPNAGGVLSVCYPESSRRTAVRDAVIPPLVFGLAVGMAAVPLALLGSRVVRRVRSIQQHTRTLADGDFRPAPVPPQDDELRDLAGAVNDLAAKLREYEHQLQQTERLRVLGQFSGGLAHQLRNAAAGAKLAVQLYLSEPGDREPLQVALRQLARIESNLSQFLSLGKPAPVVRTPVDLTEVLTAAVELHRPQCRHTGVTLAWQPGEPQMIDGDAVLLGHLFGNLIGNAVEAAGAGGKVEVDLLVGAPLVGAQSDGHPQGVPLQVLVRDTGPGPPPHLADRLFEPFITGKGQGIGLGLAVAKQAADAHAATLDWHRDAGHTVFRVVFPRTPAGGSAVL